MNVSAYTYNRYHKFERQRRGGMYEGVKRGKWRENGCNFNLSETRNKFTKTAKEHSIDMQANIKINRIDWKHPLSNDFGSS